MKKKEAKKRVEQCFWLFWTIFMYKHDEMNGL